MSNTKRKPLIVLLILLFVFSLSISLLYLHGRVSAENLFEESYGLGETITIPSKSIDVNGKQVEVSPTVILPDGTAKKVKSLELDSYGKYVVEYSKVDGGKLYKESYEFTVNIPFSDIKNQMDSAEYGNVPMYDENLYGLKVNIADGSTYGINDIVDLSLFDENKPLISFFITPEEKGVNDASYIYIKVEDFFDANSYFLIRVRQSPYSNNNLYIMAKACNQSVYAGVEKGHPENTPLKDNYHGFASSGSFYGNGVGTNSYKVNLYYDNATQTVYSDNNAYGASAGRYVIDFNNPLCFAEGYKGIQSGLARVSLYGGSYRKSSMGIIITRFADSDLTSENVVINKASNAVVDFGDYNENNYPEGVVGSAYKIFPATSQEIYTKEKINVNVFTSYYSNTKANVAVKDGAFTPQKAVTHYIEYTVIDGFGNTNKKVVPVNVIKSNTPIKVVLDSSDIVCGVGDVLEIPKPGISGGDGLVSYKITLQDKKSSYNEVIYQSNGNDNSVIKYRVVRTSDYKLQYDFVDYNGQSLKREINLNVNTADKPLFNEIPKLSKYYIRNAKYPVPTITAEDFSKGTLELIPTTCKVKVGGANVNVRDGYFTVNNNGNVEFEYSAVDSMGREASVTFSAPVVNVGFNTSIDLGAYFIKTNGETSVKTDYTLLKPTSSNANFEFIRELIGSTFECEYNIPKDMAGFDGFAFLLTDYNDSSKQVKIQIANQNGVSAVSINDGRSINMGSDFAGSKKNFALSLQGRTLSIGSTTVVINEDMKGNSFKGFDDLVYLDIRFGNVSGSAGLALYSLNRNPMLYSTTDFSVPRLVMNVSTGDKEKDSVWTLSAISVIDVLDPYTELTVTVKLPDGEYAKSTDGIVVNNVLTNRAYDIVLTEYGQYNVIYAGKDSSGNSINNKYIINCIDTVAPNVTLSDSELTASVGKEVKLPTVSCSDNNTATDKIKIYRQVIDCNGIISSIQGDTFTPEKKGVYYIKIVALDEGGNISIAEATLTVR